MCFCVCAYLSSRTGTPAWSAVCEPGEARTDKSERRRGAAQLYHFTLGLPGPHRGCSESFGSLSLVAGPMLTSRKLDGFFGPAAFVCGALLFVV